MSQLFFLAVTSNQSPQPNILGAVAKKIWLSTPINHLVAASKPLLCNETARKKNGFVTATKLGTTNKYFVAATKNFAAATKRFVDRTKHFVVVTKYFCYPYFNK